MDGNAFNSLSFFLGHSFRALVLLHPLQLQILVAGVKGQAPEKSHRRDKQRAKLDPPIHTVCL